MAISNLNEDVLQALDDEPAAERFRMARTTCRSNCSFDGDDLPLEDDLLTEIVPEEQRLKRLKEVQTPFKEDGNEPYESACHMLAEVLNIPISLMSLLYEEYQWFKAGVGLEPRYTPRCFSFCKQTLVPRKPQILYVPDALEDERFRDSPLVHSPPHIRFYCGVPLLTQDGVRLGALCIKDRKPRSVGRDVFQYLINMADVLVRLLVQEKARTKTAEESNLPLPVPTQILQQIPDGKMRRIPRMRRLQEIWFDKGLSEGVLLADATGAEWTVVWTNPQWDDWTKHGLVAGNKHDLWSVLRPLGTMSSQKMQQLISEQIASSDSGTFSSLAHVTGLDGELSKEMSCEVLSATQPIGTLDNTIDFSDNADIPCLGEPVSFGGTKLLFLFVKTTGENCLQKRTEAQGEKTNNTRAATDAKAVRESFRKPPEWKRTFRKDYASAESEEKKTAGAKLGVAHENKGAAVAKLGSESLAGQPCSAKKKAERIEQTEQVCDAAEAGQFSGSRATQIISVFESYDKEQTGQISRQELVKLISNISGEHQKTMHVELIEQLIDEKDFDHNGFIVYKDFVKFVFASSH